MINLHFYKKYKKTFPRILKHGKNLFAKLIKIF